LKCCRVRKSLTSQLHLLRQELGPKDDRLLAAAERLDEVEREYERALFSISEKEQNLSRKGESLHLLQKQLGDLRNTCSQKDATLRRVAKIFEEYKYIILQNSMKKSLHVGSLPYYTSRKELPPLPALHKDPNATATAATGANLIAAATAFGAAVGGNTYTGGLGVAGGMSKATSDSITLLNDAPSTVLGGGDNGAGGSGLGATNAATRMPQLTHSTAVATEKVEIIVRTQPVEHMLKKLGDVLKPYAASFRESDAAQQVDDTEADFEERERQVQLLHNSIDGLKTNLQHTQLVANAKVRHHVTDNMHLLKEVNDLRHDVRQLSLENQRLVANKRFTDRMRSERMERAQSFNSVKYPDGNFDGSLSPPRKSSPPPDRERQSVVSFEDSYNRPNIAMSQSMPALEYGRNMEMSEKSSSQNQNALSVIPEGSAKDSSRGKSTKDTDSAKFSVPSLSLDATARVPNAEAGQLGIDDSEFDDDLMTPGQRTQVSYEQYAALSNRSNNTTTRSIESKLDDIFSANQELIRSQQKQSKSKPGVSSSVEQLLKSYQDNSNFGETRSGSRSGKPKQQSKTTSSSSKTVGVVSSDGKKASIGQRLVTLPDMPSNKKY
jgi:hypothetical protein